LRKVIISLTIVLMIITCTSFVKAAEVSAKLTPSSTTVKKGETFTVTASATCSDGINGFSTTIQYDKNVLELVNGALADSNKWSDYSKEENVTGSREISVLPTTRENITNADLYILTFKVKDDATIGNTIISAGSISIDDSRADDSVNIIDGELIAINVTEGGALTIGGQATLERIEIVTSPTKTTYQAGEKFSPSGMVIKAIYSDGTEKEVKDYKYSPSGELSTSSDKITITYTENQVTKTTTQNITVKSSTANKDGQNNSTNNVINNNTSSNTNKDNTTTNNSIADTGLEDNMGILFVVIAIIGISSYVQYKKYKNL